MDSFEYNASPTRVIFGSGTLQKLPQELARLNLSNPLILSGPNRTQQVESLLAVLNGRTAGVFSEATMHTPIHITEKALHYARDKNADSLVSIGGGSAVGLGKAISVRMDLPHICIPTTYAGSEMTSHLGETAQGRKTTRSDPRILPGTVIYDIDLTVTLPASLSAASGVNAIAHAVEALYAQNTNPIVNLLALEGIKSLSSSLPILVSDTQDVFARRQALYGAWLCGTCLGSVSMSLHHKLCHTLGGSFNLPHSGTHVIVLPHALSYNAPAISDQLRQLAEVLPESGGDAIKGLNVLIGKLGVKRGLRELGMKEEDVDRAADIAMEKRYPNPRALDREKIREIVRRAWAGEDARADL